MTAKNPLLISGILVVLGALASGGVWYVMDGQKKELAAEILRLNEVRTLETEKYNTERASLQTTLAERDDTILALSGDKESLAERLDREKERADEIEDKVGDALKTVGVLDKLSKTDAELLQKYSKVYFLNEHYAPPRTSKIDGAFMYSTDRTQYLHAQVMSFFERMVKDAKDDGVDLYVVSAYRSFDTQSSLKSAYKVTYGSGANAFSADQGYSEHQLGTTIDFTTKGINGELVGFDATPAFTWLTKNSHKYGFTLSYPKNNAYYIYEPWHWRFVGTELAGDLKRDGNYFYDMDQREIDKYLVSIFD